MFEIDKQQLEGLVKVGFAAAAKGKVDKGRALFEHLLEAKEDSRSAKAGLAFTHLVFDDFAAGDEILDKLLQEEDDEDIKALKVLSLCLQQKGPQARELCATLSGSALATAQSCLEILKD